MGNLLTISQKKISHEFNTALSGILSNTLLLQASALSEQQITACVSDIYQSGIKLMTFMQVFLSAARQALLSQGAVDSVEAMPVPVVKPRWLSILLVEDEPIIQRVHTKMLETLGCEVTLAATGEEAIEKLNMAVSPYDLIFMDIGLPGMDGIETVKQLRQLSAHVKTPIFGLTAFQLEELQEQCHEAGFNHLMSKPVSLEKLKTILQKLATERMHYAFV